MKPIQYFSDEYLEQSKKASASEIADFLEDVRVVYENTQATGGSTLISMKMPRDLLQAFKAKCKIENYKYQTKIKELMRQFLL